MRFEMGGNAINSFLSGFLGTLGSDIQDKRAQDLTLKLNKIQAEKEALGLVINSPDASIEAKNAAFSSIIQLDETIGQPSGKRGKGGKKGGGGGVLDSISSLFTGGGKQQAQGGQPEAQAQPHGQGLPQVREFQAPQAQGPFSEEPERQRQQAKVAQVGAEESARETARLNVDEQASQRQLENYAKAVNEDPTIPAGQKAGLIARAKEIAFYPGKEPTESKFSLDQLAAQTITEMQAGRKTKEQGETILSQIAEIKSEGGKPDQAARYEQNYLAFHNLPPTPANKMKAFDEFTKKTKVEPGVIRMEALGDVRGPGSVTDTVTGQTRPMTWNEFKRMDKAYPSRFVSPAYSPDVVAAVATAHSMAPKNIGTQVQSYGTLVRHSGDTYSRISSLVNTNYPLANRSTNWLKTNTGNPSVRAFLVPLTAARTEYMTFLMNNRALYEDDREQAQALIDENATPLQMLEVLKGMVRVGTERLEEANTAYKRTSGKDFPQLISPQVEKVYREMGETPPSTKTESEPRSGGAPAGATHIAPGSDGQNHYTNDSGQDLGVAPNG
jgi:hypothetical protein